MWKVKFISDVKMRILILIGNLCEHYIYYTHTDAQHAYMYSTSTVQKCTFEDDIV